MVILKFSFLLGFSLELAKLENVNESKKNKKQKKDKQKNKESSKSKKSSKKQKDVAPKKIVEKPKYVIDLEKPIGYAHVEFDVFPNKKQSVDIICWEQVGKVFYENQSQIYKTIIRNDIVWIPVYVFFKLETFSLDELHGLRKFVNNFQIFSSKGKLGARAKGDKTKVVYFKKGDEDSDAFVEAFIVDPNNTQTDTSSSKSIHGNCLIFSDAVHEIQFNKIIRKIFECKSISYKQYMQQDDCIDDKENEFDTDNDVMQFYESLSKSIKSKKGNSKKKVKNKDDKSKSSKSTKKSKKQSKTPHVPPCKIQVSGEVFYTDPYYGTHKFENLSSPLKYAFVLTGCQHLMTLEHQLLLNPLIIKLRKLNNVPVDKLKSMGFESVYCKYYENKLLCNKTIPKTLEKKIHIDDSRVFFTNEGMDVLINLIQTKGLVIDIIGIRPRKVESKQCLIFGKKYNDKTLFDNLPYYLRHRHNVIYNTEETIATIVVDLVSLLNPKLQLLRNKCSCLNPCNTHWCKFSQQTYKDQWLLGEINLKTINNCNRTKNNICTTGDFMDFNTYLSVEIQMVLPQSTLSIQQIDSDSLYGRMCIYTSNANIVLHLFNTLVEHNQKCCNTKIIYGIYNTLNFLKDVNEIDTTNIATGFLLENGRKYFFFIETILDGIIRDIWEELMNMNDSKLLIWYGSEYVFPKRVYDDFMKIGGLLRVTLVSEIKQILKDPHVYVDGNVPIPCLNALRKMDLLLKSKHLKKIIMDCLLPTSRELLSLDIEYGVPITVQ